MARYCEYCGSSLGPDDRVCPGCGAPVSSDGSSASQAERCGIPRTIDELRAFCREKNMPLAQMRFFIGLDYPEARAFGIYQDRSGDYVVYKNKSDGSRSIRYQGPDEAYAVREIYLKLRDETEKRRSGTGYPQTVRSVDTARKKSAGLLSSIMLLIIAVAFGVALLLPYRSEKPYKGYYLYNDSYYYYQDDDWYYYSSALLDWVGVGTVDPELEDNYGDYYSSSYYHDDYGIERFGDTPYYDSDSETDDYDSDSWDYDYDSWDSDDTDWDSDW